MSDLRGGREESTSSRKRGASASTSPGSDQKTDGAKVKQDAYSPNKYEGFSSSLVSTNVNEIRYGSFTDEPVVGSTPYMPPFADLNDNSELQELPFFNLQGVCQAEKEILLNIIRNSQRYSDYLFCFMKKSPSPSAIEIDPSERCLNDCSRSGEGDGIPEVSGDPESLLGHIPDESPHLRNGPVVEIPQSHLPHVEEGGIPGVMSPGVPPTNIRTYYQSQQPLAVSSSGSGAMPPSSVQIPVSAGMMMYPQQMQQLMQQGHSAYPMPVGYPPLHYGYPQHGGQPHVTYVSPTGEPISPESVHMTGPPPGHQKSHHDGHHGMTHTSSTGPGYSKSRNHRRENVKQQQQQQQQQQPPYYYPSYGYAHGMPAYPNHQQLAQNVTGSPIIMQAPGNLYPYHQPHHPTMYSQNTTGEMEHHQSNVGIPQQMSHIPGEIPPFAQQPQHHHVPPMYHQQSPTHSTPQPSRVGGYPQPPQQRQSSSSSTVPNEPPINTTIEPSASENINTEKSGDVADISQSATVARNHPRGDSTERAAARISSETSVQKKSTVTEPLVDSPDDRSRGEPVSGTVEPKGQNLVNNVDSLSEPSRDTELVDRIQQLPPSSETSHFKGASGSENIVVDSQTKGTSLIETQEQLDDNSDTPSVNGELKDIKPGKAVPRDKLSADVVADTNKKDINTDSRQPGKTKHTESKVVAPTSNTITSARSVSVVSNSGLGKQESENGSGEFPQLSPSISNNTSNNQPSSSNSSSSSSSNSNSNTTPAAKGRSWASIASAKSQLASPDGANSKTNSGASLQGMDVGSGDGLNSSSRLGGVEQYPSIHVPISQTDKGYQDTVIDPTSIGDENDPVALALGEFLRGYVLDHHSIALTPRGLCNQGNYCYINATLQSLLACPPFVNLFRSMGEILNKRPCRATPIIQNVFELVSEFEPLLRGNANKKERIKDQFIVGANLEPIGIRKCLGLLEGSTFKVEGRQEDAEEFLSHLLNGLHDEMLKVMKWAELKKERSSGKPASATVPTAPLVGATNGDGVEISGDEDDDQWQVMGAKNKSCLTRKTTICKTPISEAFLGQMCYLYRESSTGSHKSATLQPFYTLQLDIQSDSIRSVKDALDAISAREDVSGVISANGSEIEAWRQLSLDELPVVLILHLKRFVYEKNGNKIRKIDKKLDFGIDLEIGKEMLSSAAKPRFNLRHRQYKLFGVVYHDGEEAHKGHYIADCFHASGGSMWGNCGWLRFDDTAVKPIPENQMLNPQPPRVPYLLYYRRGDTLLSHHVTQQQQQQQYKKDRP